MLSDRQVSRVFGLLESSGIIEELRRSEGLSFDWHADVIAKVMGQKLFSNAVTSVKKSFKRKKLAGDIKQN
jgi:hypothetical protein